MPPLQRQQQRLRLRIKKLYASQLFEDMLPLLQACRKRPLEQLIVDKTGVVMRYLHFAGGESAFLMRPNGYRYLSPDQQEALRAVLLDILDTPVSPELLPANENGEIAQQTESLVGPYELHDFYLYYVLRFGFGPAKIYRLARHALGDRYPDDVLLHWLKNFYRRFFAQQFKRSCLPDGPKIGSVTLSPRGDWRMPSDACAAVWQAELDQLG